MPFVSKKQRAYLFSQHPDVAREFAAHTSPEEEKNLPERKKKSRVKPPKDLGPVPAKK